MLFSHFPAAYKPVYQNTVRSSTCFLFLGIKIASKSGISKHNVSGQEANVVLGADSNNKPVYASTLEQKESFLLVNIFKPEN